MGRCCTQTDEDTHAINTHTQLIFPKCFVSNKHMCKWWVGGLVCSSTLFVHRFVHPPARPYHLLLVPCSFLLADYPYVSVSMTAALSESLSAQSFQVETVRWHYIWFSIRIPNRHRQTAIPFNGYSINEQRTMIVHFGFIIMPIQRQ